MARQRDTKETRERIINSATELFIEKGYSRTTLEDIVQRVGLTRGAFYWNFKTKKDILDEILNRYESFYREIYHSYTRSDSALETVRSFLTLDFQKKNAVNPYTIIILYKVEACDEFSEISELHAQMDREFVTTIEGEVRRGQERGEFRTDVDARILTQSIYMNLLGFDTYNASREPRADGTYFSDEEIDVLVDTLLKGLL